MKRLGKLKSASCPNVHPLDFRGSDEIWWKNWGDVEETQRENFTTFLPLKRETVRLCCIGYTSMALKPDKCECKTWLPTYSTHNLWNASLWASVYFCVNWGLNDYHNSLVEQWAKDLALPLQQHESLLWCRVDPWPKNLHMPRAWPKKKKKMALLVELVCIVINNLKMKSN